MANPGQDARRRRWRWVLPVALVLVWLVVGGPLGSYAGKLSEVQVNDSLLFLPESAESTVVAQAQARFAQADTVPAVVVFEADNGALSAAQLGRIQSLTRELSAVPGVVGPTSPAVPAQDGRAAAAFLPVSSAEQETTTATVDQLRELVADNPIPGVTATVGGPAGFVADLTEAFGGIDGLLLLVALVVVLVILLIVYRSPILPFLVLFTAVLALGVAAAVIYALAARDVITLNGQAQGILSILVIGAATDYSLLLVARFREELRHASSSYDAMRAAWRGVVAPILASGSTVILGVLVLLLSDLKANKALGPVGAIGIAVSMAAALTFLPAVLVLLGRAGFWPARPEFGSHGVEASGLWGRIADRVGRHPRLTWVVPTVVLLGLAALAPTFKAQGIPSSDFFTTDVESSATQEALARHFPAGSGSETIVITPAGELPRTLAVTRATPGVASAVPLTAAGAAPGQGEPRTVAGTALVQVTLADASDSAAAEQTVVALRAALDDVSPDVLVGGPTAAQFDTNTTAENDNRRIIPVVLLVILLVLVVLLRAVVAPVLLMLTVVLSFAATLGLAALVFNGILDLPGADPSVPLFAFVFLVALGIDYNIFLMTRAREEVGRRGNRAGMLRALAVTGGVITSAGLVLAATFGALAVLPLLFLFQVAFLVSVGVLVDTLVVRSLLVPGAVLDIGPLVWWPSRLARERSERSADPA